MLTFTKILGGYTVELRNLARLDFRRDSLGTSVHVFFTSFNAVKRAREAVKRVNNKVGLQGNPEKVYSKTFKHSEPISEA
jgi:hypothetical protein